MKSCTEKFPLDKNSKQTVLHLAVKKTDESCVKYFIDSGIEVDNENERDGTALSIALRTISQNKHKESITEINCRIIKLLHGNGAKLDAIKYKGTHGTKLEIRKKEYKTILEKCLKGNVKNEIIIKYILYY